MTGSPTLILASSSSYRKQQLMSLGVEFIVSRPDVDESALNDEMPELLTHRLARAKASKIKIENPDACVIGSDQVCAFDGRIYGKPGCDVNATKQLQIFSGNRIEFFTALCVISESGDIHEYVDTTVVHFRVLSDDEIVRYVQQDQPLNCAGGFKVESLGLSLFESIVSNDPSALVGLPLIKLCAFLRSCGYQIP